MARKKRPSHRIAPQADPVEAIQRIVSSSRQLIISDGDVRIDRTHGVRATAIGAHYEVCIVGVSGSTERFATFERAAVRGEDLARTRRVRLFYRDSPDDPPYLLRDNRPS
jgi:hypothetical protein